MWCNCQGGGRRGFKKIEGILWGCENCARPTRLVFKKFTAMRAPVGAVALISVHGRRDGINEITFALRGGERKTVLEVAGNAGVLERLWTELDATTDSIMGLVSLSPDEMAEASKQIESLRIRARTQAETLVMFMYPFFSNIEEVSREAHARYKARQAGTEHYTPGISGEEYVPPRAPAPKEPAQATPVATKTRAKRTGKSLPPDALATIREGVTSGMFTISQIAKSYGLSVDETKEQLGLD